MSPVQEFTKSLPGGKLFSPVKNGLTKGESETAIRNAVIKFEQEFMGRGPTEVKAFILRDMVLVRLKGVLTPAERQLAKNAEGVDMVKRMRQNLISQGRETPLQPDIRHHRSRSHGPVHRHRNAQR